MEKKITLKLWLVVFFRGIWQVLCNIFSWRNKTPFWRVIGAVITFCILAVTLIACYAFYDEFYVRRHGWYYGDEITRISPNMLLYDIERGRGKSYVKDTHTGNKVLKGLDWVACSEDGDSLAVFSKGGKRGYFNRITGEVVIPARYDAAWCFNDSVAGVCVGDSVFFIDHGGNPLNQRKFPRREGIAYIYHGGLAVITEGNKYGLVDRAGKDVLFPHYDYIDDTLKGMWLIGKDGQYGLLDAEGRPVVPTCYSNVSVRDEGGIIITLADRTKKRLDYDGSLLDDFVYDYVERIGYATDSTGDEGENIVRFTGMYAYDVDGYKGLMDTQGHPVTLPLYSEIEALTPVLFDCRIAGTGANILVDAKGKKVND